MIISYTLDRAHYLIHQLYFASKSANFKRQRQNTRILLFVMLVVSCVYLLSNENIKFASILGIVGIITCFTYPRWERMRQYQHLENAMNEIYKNRFGALTILQINDNYIIETEGEKESKYALTAIEEINEISEAILIKLKTGEGMIIPKNKIAELDTLRDKLKSIAVRLSVPYDVDNNWKWR